LKRRVISAESRKKISATGTPHTGVVTTRRRGNDDACAANPWNNNGVLVLKALHLIGEFAVFARGVCGEDRIQPIPLALTHQE
jgi:hypothetical protein